MTFKEAVKWAREGCLVKRHNWNMYKTIYNYKTGLFFDGDHKGYRPSTNDKNAIDWEIARLPLKV